MKKKFGYRRKLMVLFTTEVSSCSDVMIHSYHLLVNEYGKFGFFLQVQQLLFLNSSGSFCPISNILQESNPPHRNTDIVDELRSA